MTPAPEGWAPRHRPIGKRLHSRTHYFRAGRSLCGVHELHPSYAAQLSFTLLDDLTARPWPGSKACRGCSDRAF